MALIFFQLGLISDSRVSTESPDHACGNNYMYCQNSYTINITNLVIVTKIVSTDKKSSADKKFRQNIKDYSPAISNVTVLWHTNITNLVIVTKIVSTDKKSSADKKFRQNIKDYSPAISNVTVLWHTTWFLYMLLLLKWIQGGPRGLSQIFFGVKVMTIKLMPAQIIQMMAFTGIMAIWTPAITL